MKQKNIFTLAVVAFVAALFSYVIAGKVFDASKVHKLKAPVVQKIDSNFPQVSNDSQYQAFFNNQALDPTQLIQIGTSQNKTPFNGQ